VSDADCVAFLQWALPRLRMRWDGFRKVRRQVCRRVERRRRALGLDGLSAYRVYLEQHEDEWAVLDSLCRVTISRFYRDRAVFAFLEGEVLPELAQNTVADGRAALEAWSAGCASGEEPYTLALVWELGLAARDAELDLHVRATDADEALLERAREACYRPSSLKELPDEWRRRAFVSRGELFCLRDELKRRVTLGRHDVRGGPPPGGPFDLVLCRNLVFTYMDDALQREVTGWILDVLRPGGALVVGAHETPPDLGALAPWSAGLGVYRRSTGGGR
jgi:chemotaxis protein methyltransferase CheR